jgi:hypothetical protein
MRTVHDLYTQYRINHGLQLHQLRVAAVGIMVARTQKVPVDERMVVLACLFHDMGNILKFDMSGTMPEFFEPEGIEYWQKVQDEFREQYGASEHEATDAIARDFGLDERALDLINGMGFSKAPAVLASGNRELMIVEYADQRVTPRGVTSMKERFEEGSRRYAERGGYGGGGISNPEVSALSIPALEEIERQLFQDLAFTPQDITDKSVAPLIEDLRKYEVA